MHTVSACLFLFSVLQLLYKIWEYFGREKLLSILYEALKCFFHENTFVCFGMFFMNLDSALIDVSPEALNVCLHYNLDSRKGPKSSEHCKSSTVLQALINTVFRAQGYGLIKVLRVLMAQWKVIFCSVLRALRTLSTTVVF